MCRCAKALCVTFNRDTIDRANDKTVRELGHSRGSGDQVARVGLVHKTKTLPTSLTSGITPPTHSGTGMQEEIPLQ